MNLVIGSSSNVLWQDVIKLAESRCCVSLQQDLEAYLVSLLVRYTNRPDIAKQVLATAFLEAIQLQERQRHFSLQSVGDQCLLFAGLFPKLAEKKRVKIGYFVDIGRSAYAAISQTTDDLYGSLALQFVVLMDILQSIRQYPDLLPLEAYEQWEEVGSQRALKLLQAYTSGVPVKNNRQ